MTFLSYFEIRPIGSSRHTVKSDIIQLHKEGAKGADDLGTGNSLIY